MDSSIEFSKYAAFHPHYSVKMDKAHIYLESYPLAMVYSSGTDSDPSHLQPLPYKVKALNPRLINELIFGSSGSGNRIVVQEEGRGLIIG